MDKERSPANLSPTEIADAVLAEAIAENAGGMNSDPRRSNDTRSGNGGSDGIVPGATYDLTINNGQELTVDLIRKTWEGTKDNDEKEKAYKATLAILMDEVESLLRSGLEAFHNWEKTAHENMILKEELKGKEMELERIRVAEEKNRETIKVRQKFSTRRAGLPVSTHPLVHQLLLPQNLLQASEKTKLDTQDAARAAVTAAALRADLAVTRNDRDEFQSQAEEAKRKSILMDDQLRNIKTKLSRITQEKLKMERDQRATMSLAKTLDSHTNSDTEYYKRKVTELSTHVQQLNVILAEKNRQLEDTRRQLDRSSLSNDLRTPGGKGIRKRKFN